MDKGHSISTVKCYHTSPLLKGMTAKRLLLHLAVDGSADTPTNEDDWPVWVGPLDVADPGGDAGDHVAKVGASLGAIGLQLCKLNK